MEKNDFLEVTITDIGNDGEGIGKVDGYALFVKDAVIGDKALVTGENLGQVASQTLENMGVISQSVPDMILRPLLTFDKLDTIGIAREIGTYELSIEEVPDSCTVFAPPDPTTAAQLEAVLKNEELLDIPGLVRTCLEQSIRINPNTLHEHPLLGGQSAEPNHT